MYIYIFIYIYIYKYAYIYIYKHIYIYIYTSYGARSIRKMRVPESKFLGSSLMDLGVPPLRIENLPEPNPLNSGIYVQNQRHAIPRLFRFVEPF